MNPLEDLHPKDHVEMYWTRCLPHTIAKYLALAMPKAFRFICRRASWNVGPSPPRCPCSINLTNDTTAARRCVITASNIELPTNTNWYVIYLAATAVDAMCVRRGRAGIGVHIGYGE